MGVAAMVVGEVGKFVYSMIDLDLTDAVDSFIESRLIESYCSWKVVLEQVQSIDNY